MLLRGYRLIAYCLILLLYLPCCLSAKDHADSSVVYQINELNHRARMLNRDSTNRALTLSHEAYLLSIKEKLPYWQGVSLLNLSEGYLYNDSYDQALQYAYNALDIFSSIDSLSGIAEAHTMLGWIFYDTENSGFALKYHEEALQNYLSLRNEENATLSLNAIGLVYQMKNQNDSAEIYFNKSLQKARKNGLIYLERAALNNLGICANASGDYKKAIQLFNQAIKTGSAPMGELALAEVYNQMAFSYLKTGAFKMADSLLQASRNFINSSSSNTRKEKLLDNLQTSAQLFQQLGDFKRAYQSLQEYTAINNELVSRNKTEVVLALHMKREAMEKQEKINELNAQKELRIFQRNALGVGILLVITIGILAYSRFRQKRKREQQAELVKQLLIKDELERERKQNENLSSKLEYNNNHLTDYALFISRNDELLNDFLKSLSEICSNPAVSREIQSEVNKAIKIFNIEYEQHKENQQISLEIESKQAGFFHNLTKKFPNLTEYEQRLCGQIRMNLSSKEIAASNNISVKSVEMARYRLRRQLRLETKDSLNEFLKQF